jgi:hypothetical protein
MGSQRLFLQTIDALLARKKASISSCGYVDWVNMSTRTLLLIILILVLIGSLPTWPYSSGWGYYPTGGIGLVLLIVLILWLLGVI